MTEDLELALRAGPVETEPGATAALTRRFAERAGADGLADVTYAVEPSPLGDLLVAISDRGLLRLSYIAYAPPDATLDDLAARISPRIVEAPGRLDGVRRELDEYFAGSRRAFDVPIDWRLTRGFGQRILRATARVPYGQATTYKEVATEAGSPRAVRAAGNALGANPIPIVIPCHRVLRTGGTMGGYTGGVERKAHLLALEGTVLG